MGRDDCETGPRSGQSIPRYHSSRFSQQFLASPFDRAKIETVLDSRSEFLLVNLDAMGLGKSI